MDTIKICVAYSAGGHYLEAMKACRKLFECKYELFHLTYWQEGREYNETFKIQFVKHPEHGFLLKRIFLLGLNFIDSLKVYLKERPDVIISTGADVTFNIMLIGKIFGKKIVFIESGANVTKPSLTGRLIYRFSDLFIVQWPELLKSYPKAVYGGPLL